MTSCGASGSTPMFRPARWTPTGVIAPADIALPMTRRRRCAVRHQHHEVRGLRSGPGSGLVVSIALANTVCATTRPRRRRCAAHQEDRQLITRAGRGSARQSRAVQSWQKSRQRPPVSRRHTAGGTRRRWISGQDLATGQQGSQHRGLLFRPRSTRVAVSSRVALVAGRHATAVPREPLAEPDHA